MQPIASAEALDSLHEQHRQTTPQIKGYVTADNSVATLFVCCFVQSLLYSRSYVSGRAHPCSKAWAEKTLTDLFCISSRLQGIHGALHVVRVLVVGKPFFRCRSRILEA